MKTALIHDWIITLGGAERVLKELCQIFTEADIYTLILKKESVEKLGLDFKKVKTSFLQRIPYSAKIYKYLLPIMPNAVESFDLRHYDLVISSSHCVAKGILTNSNQIHFAYVHTPMRYAWDLYHSFIEVLGINKGLKGLIAGQIFKKIRMWDLITANRADYYIANSYCVAKRIKRIYGKDSTVIYPPVDVELFKPSAKKENFYITAGRLVPYKRIDLIVKAFSMMKNRKLIIIGDGVEMKRLKGMATSNIEFLGYQEEKTLAQYLSSARAFIFSAEEDFGILPVEAQACGTPVIAYKGGGATETVLDGVTGIFFERQVPEAIIEAINKFEKIENKFVSEEIIKNAERFNRRRFREEFLGFINSTLKQI